MVLTSDAHCDTITLTYQNNEVLLKNLGHLDLTRLSRPWLQFFAVFVYPADYPDRQISEYMKYLNFMDTQIADNTALVDKVTSSVQLVETVKNNKIAVIYAIEGADCIESVEHVDLLYDKGVRSIGIVWNHKNALGSGVDYNEGLTQLGKNVIRRMEELGIIIDVSHTCRKTFDDIIDNTSGPIIASHSNSFSLCNHLRNLADDQIQTIAQRKGYIGLNLYPPFLSTTGNTNLDDVISHYKHITHIGGADIIGLGCDFDGVEDLPIGIMDVSSIHIIFDKMKEIGFPEQSIRNFRGENLYNFIVGLQYW